MPRQVAEVNHERRTIITVLEWPDEAVILEGCPIMPLEDALSAGYTHVDPEPEPVLVQLWQLKAAIEIQGLGGRIDAWMDKLPTRDKAAFRAAWQNHVGTIREDSRTISLVASGIGLDNAGVRRLFNLASGITLP